MDYIILSWFIFWGICYRLREFSGIWHKYSHRKWMLNSKWWMSTRNEYKCKWYHETTFYTFLDSYHFFGNLPRITGAILLGILQYEYIALAFCGWFLGEYFILKYIIGDR